MSGHGGTSHTSTGLPAVAAVSLETANSLSWMLGERVTSEDDRATLMGEWTANDSRACLSRFDVTAETAILRYRSLAGRDHYVGTTREEARQAGINIEASPCWQRVDEK